MARLDIAELLAAMGAQSTLTPTDRQQAIARFLSAADGWEDAIAALGGAFADDGGKTRLTPEKGE